MCGILGWVSPQAPSCINQFSTALDLLSHRGPDDRGIWQGPNTLFGHRRLSIVDLSDMGHQPMVDPVSHSVLIFNGEIYNFVELKQQLLQLGHHFVGNSDTEVLLHSLVQWGISALPRLNGMWSFAFWDPRESKILLARDRFGVKPLYYRYGVGGFAFASEPKSLLHLFPQHRSVSESTVIDFLAHNRLFSAGESFYKGIHVFPQAHYAVVDCADSSFAISRYWDYPSDINHEIHIDDACHQFDNLFTDSVRLRLRSDVTVGLTLSGGLDSTSILAASNRLSSNPLTSFTSVYSAEESGELSWARLATNSTDSPLTAVLAPQTDWLNTMRLVAWHMDGPGYSPAVYPLWHLMRRARHDAVPVLLEGQGADEALAGYPQYFVLEFLQYLQGSHSTRPNLQGIISRFTSLIRSFSLKWTLAWIARESTPSLLAWHRRRVGFQSFMRDDIPSPECGTYSSRPFRNILSERLISDHSTNILPGLLQYGDSISMAHSVEARHPFLDYRLVEWMFSMPSNILFARSKTKFVLRDYLIRNQQQAIARRPDKKGYPTPVSKWLASNQGGEIENLLLDNTSQLYEWCDLNKVRRLIHLQKRGALGADHHLYKLLSTSLWLQECISAPR